MGGNGTGYVESGYGEDVVGDLRERISFARSYSFSFCMVILCTMKILWSKVFFYDIIADINNNALVFRKV